MSTIALGLLGRCAVCGRSLAGQATITRTDGSHVCLTGCVVLGRKN